MNRTSGWLPGARGRRLFWRGWTGEQPPQRTVAIVHGAGEHGGRYEHVAARLVAGGAAVYALDHRGHGRSSGPRALIEDLDLAVADLDELVRALGAPVVMLGHSMGATIALRYALVHPERLAGLVLTGALAALDPTPAPLRVLARVLSAVAPATPLIPIDPATVSRDPRVVADYRADPLVHHGRLPARTAVELADAIEALPGSVWAIRTPTLILYGTADRLVPPAGSEMLGDRIGADDVTIKAYEGLFHEILNEPEREAVLDDIERWLAGRTLVSAVRPGGSIRS